MKVEEEEEKEEEEMLREGGCWEKESLREGERCGGVWFLKKIGKITLTPLRSIVIRFKPPRF